jgi:hypothetical protein
VATAKKPRPEVPKSNDPPGMPGPLRFFDPDEWPLLARVEVDNQWDLNHARRRRAWRTARAAWLDRAEFTDLARDERRMCSREYADAMRRSPEFWKDQR